jgi:hypothetical protein
LEAQVEEAEEAEGPDQQLTRVRMELPEDAMGQGAEAEHPPLRLLRVEMEDLAAAVEGKARPLGLVELPMAAVLVILGLAAVAFRSTLLVLLV